jgi:hypothetical protein
MVGTSAFKPVIPNVNGTALGGFLNVERGVLLKGALRRAILQLLSFLLFITHFNEMVQCIGTIGNIQNYVDCRYT